MEVIQRMTIQVKFLFFVIGDPPISSMMIFISQFLSTHSVTDRWQANNFHPVPSYQNLLDSDAKHGLAKKWSGQPDRLLCR